MTFYLVQANTNGPNDYWMRAETLEIDRSGAGPPYQSLGHVAEATYFALQTTGGFR